MIEWNQIIGSYDYMRYDPWEQEGSEISNRIVLSLLPSFQAACIIRGYYHILKNQWRDIVIVEWLSHGRHYQ